MTEAVETNGAGVDLNTALLADIDVALNDVGQHAQRAEVALKFLCEARTLAREGKLELAERKKRAAARVLSGEPIDE